MGNAESGNSTTDNPSSQAKNRASSVPAPFYGLLGTGDGASSLPTEVDMARGGGARIPDSPELQAAIGKVREAIGADEGRRAEDALRLYQEAVELFLGVLKKEKDPGAQGELKKRVSDYLSRAEAIKSQLASRPPPPAPQGPVGDRKRPVVGGGGPCKPTRKPSSSSSSSSSIVLPPFHHPPPGQKPDDYDYTAAAKKVPSSSSTIGGTATGGSGVHKRAASLPNSRALIGGRGGGSTGRGGGGRGGAASGTSSGGACVGGALPQPSNDMEAVIMNEMLDRSPGVKWDHIAGLEVAKQTLQEAVVLPNLRPDLFTGLRSPPRGVLLFGPPGTGKTLLAKAVASESGFAFFSISASSLVSKYLGDGEKMVRALFSVARQLQPSVIFMDEIDSILSARRENEHEASRRLKTEFLVQLDGAGTDSTDRILVMGATNLPWALDEAVLRRLVKKVYIPLPDVPARKALIKHLLSTQKHGMRDADLNELVRATEHYSCSDLTAVCKEAAMQPIRDLGANVRTASIEELRPLKLSDFLHATSRIRPSVSTASIQQFEAWHKDNGY